MHPHFAARRAVVAAFAAFVLCFTGSRIADAAASSGAPIRGRVSSPDGQPLPGVTVTLSNDLTGYRQEVSTRGDGSYLLYNVPENPYRLDFHLAGFADAHAPLEVRGAAPIRRDVTLSLEVAATATVRAEREAVALETDDPATHVDIDRSIIRRSAAALPSRAFESLVTSTPGFSQDENGRYHFQGGHSQQLLVIDGQPIGDQIGITFSNSLDPAVADNLEVITGGIPAEYGEKANGVLNLTTRSGLGLGGVKGDVSLGGASFGTAEGAAAAGGGSARFGWFLNLDAARSGRFLDPVSFENFHNQGHTERAFARLDSSSGGGSDALRLTASAGRTRRDVPNLPSQEAAGQDQGVVSRDWNANLGWQHVEPSGLVVEAQAYARDNRLALSSSPFDTPVRADQDRSLANQGIGVALSRTVGIHDLKVGVQAKRFPIRESFRFGITDPVFNDPSASGYNPNLAPYDLTRGGAYFAFDGARAGSYLAAFAQDTVRLGPVTVNAGLRYDHNRLFESESQLQPRLGAAFSLEATRTVLWASYDRMFITPEYENILLSSSAQAAALTPPDVQASNLLGFGRLHNVSERHDAYDVGLQQAVGRRVRVDLSYWRRNVANAADQDQFLNTGVVFPLNFKGARLHGWNLRVDLAPVAGFRGYLSLGHVRAIYEPPFVGGLFLDSGALGTLTGGPFVIDHDQDLQEQLGVFWDAPGGVLWTGVTQRYDSGLVTDAGTLTDVLSSPDTAYAAPYIRFDGNPQRVAPRTVWNLSIGARLETLGLPLEAQLDLLNAFDEKGLYNFRSVFGGTHVIPPRMLAGRLKYVF